MTPEKKDFFLSVFEEFKRESQQKEEDLSLSESYLTEEIDHEILQHRDAHFAGDFKVMHDYYQEEHMRQHPEITLERIAYLAKIEAELNQNLAEVFLSEQEKQEVMAARHAYETLKELYLEKKEEGLFSRLLADLILTEDEDAEQEIEQIVLQDKKIVPYLIKIIASKEAYHPLFPGYGYAPYFAALCLGKIRDPAAITPLFEALNEETLFGEEVFLDALKNMGEPAKKYLLERLNSRPITKENSNAAYALTLFSPDLQIAETAFTNLKDPLVCKATLFATYLIFNLEGLKNTPLQQELRTWSQTAPLSASLQRELQAFYV